VRESHPELQLLIVGEPREFWDECMRLIAEKGCGDSVRLLGAQPRSTVINLMNRAIALILPSRSEGLGYVLLEAGAVGLPVICSDIAPFREVIEHEKTALVTPVEDAAAIAAAVDRIVSNPEWARAMGCALSAHVHTHFSASEMARRYRLTYEAVVVQEKPGQSSH
jgi:glycosyltransferase involved in cell wall biosynthesis